MDRFIYSLVFGFAISEKWGAFLEAYGHKTSGVPFDARADAGLTWLVRPNFQWDLSGGLKITEISPVGFVSAGFSWRIPR